jgi:hypothetical protein
MVERVCQSSPHPPKTLLPFSLVVLGKFEILPNPILPPLTLSTSSLGPFLTISVVFPPPSDPRHLDVSIVVDPSITEFAG